VRSGGGVEIWSRHQISTPPSAEVRIVGSIGVADLDREYSGGVRMTVILLLRCRDEA